MADRIEVFNVTVPASTPQAAPQRTALSFRDGIVTDIEITVPPGPSGFAGFRLDYGGQQIIPEAGGTFIVTDNEIMRWPVKDFPTGRQWQCVAYNTDIYPHTFRFRFLIDEIQAPTLPSPVIQPTGPTALPGSEEATFTEGEPGEEEVKEVTGLTEAILERGATPIISPDIPPKLYLGTS